MPLDLLEEEYGPQFYVSLHKYSLKYTAFTMNTVKTNSREQKEIFLQKVAFFCLHSKLKLLCFIKKRFLTQGEHINVIN